MKIASFKTGTTATFGIVTDAGIIDAGNRLKAYPTLNALLTKGSLDELKALKGERPDCAASHFLFDAFSLREPVSTLKTPCVNQ